jgi:hypothetical protein
MKEAGGITHKILKPLRREGLWKNLFSDIPAKAGIQ